jgi:hypothetical protein
MKLILTLIALATLSGCATQTSTGEQLTAAQVAAKVCPSVKITLSNLQTLQGLSDHSVEMLAKGQKLVDVVCTPGSLPTKFDLETLITEGGPFAISLIKDSNLSPADKDQSILNITMIQILAQGLLQSMDALK